MSFEHLLELETLIIVGAHIVLLSYLIYKMVRIELEALK